MTNRIQLDNLEEYDDPAAYDQENNHYVGELPLLLEWAGKVNGPIIDLACGTGRLTLPLAKEGYQLIGIDVHKGMLEQAAKKAGKLNLDIQWLQQDCTNFQAGIRSPFIYMVGNSIQHFHTNEAQDQLLSSIKQHLQEDGIFIFDTRFPSANELLQPATEEYWKTYMDGENEIDLYTISSYDALKQIQHYTTIRKYKDHSAKIIDEKITNISLRYTYPLEMERVLKEHNLEIVNVYKDWKGTSIDSDSDYVVYICRKLPPR